MLAALQAAREWLRPKAAAAQALACIARSLLGMLQQRGALLEPRHENEALMVLPTSPVNTLKFAVWIILNHCCSGQCSVVNIQSRFKTCLLALRWAAMLCGFIVFETLSKSC